MRSCPTSMSEKKKRPYVVMIDTAVDEVTTPTRKANAMSVATTRRITAPPTKKRGWTTCVFHMTISQIEPRR